MTTKDRKKMVKQRAIIKKCLCCGQPRPRDCDNKTVFCIRCHDKLYGHDERRNSAASQREHDAYVTRLRARQAQAYESSEEARLMRQISGRAYRASDLREYRSIRRVEEIPENTRPFTASEVAQWNALPYHLAQQAYLASIERRGQ